MKVPSQCCVRILASSLKVKECIVLLKLFKPIALFLCAIILLVGSACNLPTGSNTSSESRIPVSEQTASNLEENASQTLQNLLNGQPTSITINETELTSLVVYRLEQQSDGAISDSQVFLRDGLIQYRGTLSQPPI